MPGKPGNKNALKHGFYAKRMSSSEQKRADSAGPGDFSGEIAWCRAVVDRIAVRVSKSGLDANSTAKIDEDTVKILGTMTLVLQSMATMARTHYLISGNSSDVEQSIWDALEELRLEMGI